MCDYSLMIFPNRLANEGEILVTHKFSTGAIGFVSPMDLCAPAAVRPQCVTVSFWSKVRDWFAVPPGRTTIPAVCVPPGASLKVHSVPVNIQRVFRAAPGDDVFFTEMSATWGQFRDGLRVQGKEEILLQSLGEGLAVQVLDLVSSQEAPQREEYTYSLVPRR